MKKNLNNVETEKINNILKSIYLNSPKWSAKLFDEPINKKELSILEKMGIMHCAAETVYNYLTEQGYNNSESLEITQNVTNAMFWDDNFYYFANDFELGEINDIPVILYSFYASDNSAIFTKIEYNNNFYNVRL